MYKYLFEICFRQCKLCRHGLKGMFISYLDNYDDYRTQVCKNDQKIVETLGLYNVVKVEHFLKMDPAHPDPIVSPPNNKKISAKFKSLLFT